RMPGRVHMAPCGAACGTVARSTASSGFAGGILTDRPDAFGKGIQRDRIRRLPAKTLHDGALGFVLDRQLALDRTSFNISLSFRNRCCRRTCRTPAGYYRARTIMTFLGRVATGGCG